MARRARLGCGPRWSASIRHRQLVDPARRGGRCASGREDLACGAWADAIRNGGGGGETHVHLHNLIERLCAWRLCGTHGRGKDAKVRMAVIADNLVSAAVRGEPWAIKECFDRIDGKPMQAIEAKVELISSMSDEQLDRELRAAVVALNLAGDGTDTSDGRPN